VPAVELDRLYVNASSRQPLQIVCKLRGRVPFILRAASGEHGGNARERRRAEFWRHIAAKRDHAARAVRRRCSGAKSRRHTLRKAGKYQRVSWRPLA